jgi:hypothetical protein
MKETLVGLFLRNGGNLHYFANLEPYLARLRFRPGVVLVILVTQGMGGHEDAPEYRGHGPLFDPNLRVDDCDLVLTPTFLRPEDRPGPRNPHARVAQVFHGMSDKPFTYERDFRGHDLCLCAGQRQADRLLAHEHNRGVAWAKVGYPKFDAMAAASSPAAGGHPAVIYCPTWRKGGISSIERFLDHPEVAAELTRRYDLIVKPHPNVLNPARPFYDPSIVERLQRLERLPGVTLVRSGNVMPWQSRATLFVGDISAAGYEWLYFDRPMVFLNPRPGELRPSPDVRALTYLWQCGPVCDDVRDLPGTVDAALARDRHGPLREAILHYSVHQPRDGGAVDRALAALEARGFLPTAPAAAMADA